MTLRRLVFMGLALSCFLFAVQTAIPQSVRVLEISRQNASFLKQIGNYPDLEVLSISCLESLQALPDSVGKLAKLRELRIDNGNGGAMNPVLPESIGNLRLRRAGPSS
jgi:hypothetical protein